MERRYYANDRVRFALLLAAVICLGVFTIIALGADWPRPSAWLGAGLTAFAASFL